LTTRELGALIRVSGVTISQVFNGKYGAKLDAVVKEIDSFFALEDSRSEGRKLPFIETDLTKRIWQVCNAAREFQKFAFIFGDSHIGKSTSLESFRDAHNHGSTIYAYIPTGATFTNFLYILAKPLRIPLNIPVSRLRERIIDSFDDRMLLLVDEIHNVIRPTSSMRSLDCIEFVREIFNTKKCGVVASGTNVFRDAMEKGDLYKILGQTKRRRLCTLQLPNKPTQKDLNTFAAFYGLPPSTGAARDLEKKIVEDEALGMWLTLLRSASKIAFQRKETMSWEHVHFADAGMKALESSTF